MAEECVLPNAGKSVSRRHAAITFGHHADADPHTAAAVGGGCFQLRCLHEKNQILLDGRPLLAGDDAVELEDGAAAAPPATPAFRLPGGGV